MATINDNDLKLKASYLFPEIAPRINAFVSYQFAKCLLQITPPAPPVSPGLFHSRKAPQAGSLGLQKPSLPAQAITILQYLVREGGLRSCSRTL